MPSPNSAWPEWVFRALPRHWYFGLAGSRSQLPETDIKTRLLEHCLRSKRPLTMMRLPFGGFTKAVRISCVANRRSNPKMIVSAGIRSSLMPKAT
jgi:hypothetical protein